MHCVARYPPLVHLASDKVLHSPSRACLEVELTLGVGVSDITVGRYHISRVEVAKFCRFKKKKKSLQKQICSCKHKHCLDNFGFAAAKLWI